MILQTIIQQQSSISNNLRYIETNEVGHYSLGLSQAQYNPQMYNRGGYSVWGYQGNKESSRECRVYLYNHNTKKLTNALIGFYPSGDFHNNSSYLILPDGKIFIVQTRGHNSSIDIYLSDNPYDINNLTLQSIFSASNPSYMCVGLLGSRIYGNYRTFAGINRLVYTEDNGATWSNPLVVCDLDGDTEDYWAYPRLIYSNTEYIWGVNRRNKVDGDFYDKLYIFKTTDGVNVLNYSGSFTHDISVSSISNSDLDTNYEIGTDIGFADAFIEVGSKLYVYTFGTVHIQDGASYSNVSLDSGSDTYITNGRSSFVSKTDGSLTLICRGTVNGVAGMYRLNSSDDFATFTSELIQENTNDGVFTATVAINQQQTLQTSLVFLERTSYGSGSIQDPDNSYSNFYLLEDESVV